MAETILNISQCDVNKNIVEILEMLFQQTKSAGTSQIIVDRICDIFKGHFYQSAELKINSISDTEATCTVHYTGKSSKQFNIDLTGKEPLVTEAR